MNENDFRDEDAPDTPAFGAKSGSSGAQGKSQAGLAARAGTSNVPSDVTKAVLAFDRTYRGERNIPDQKYGPVVMDGVKNDDGTWTVRVGSMETSVAGPKEGTKPIDIATYTFKDGKVTSGEARGGGGADAGKAGASFAKSKSMSPLDRKVEEEGSLKVSAKGETESEEPIYDEGKGGFRGELKSETRAPNAPSKMGPAKPIANKSKAGKPDAESDVDLDIDKPSSAGAKGIAKGESKDFAKGDPKDQTASKAIIDKAVIAAKGLIDMNDDGDPRLLDHPEPQAIKRFQSFLGGLEQSSKLAEFKKAAQECQGHAEKSAKGGLSDESGGGHFQIVSQLVEKYGTDSQKNAWKK